MGENKGMLILGGIVVFSITVLSLTTALTTKSTHQKRMELIEEKEALFDLQRHVDIEKTIPQENFVTYEVKYYGGNVDTSKIKIVWPFIGLTNTATYDYLQLNKQVCKSDTLFFEDYFKDCYRILAGLPCGFKQSEYSYKIKLVYQDVVTGQYFNFTSQELKYDCKPGHIVLDIQ